MRKSSHPHRLIQNILNPSICGCITNGPKLYVIVRPNKLMEEREKKEKEEEFMEIKLKREGNIIKIPKSNLGKIRFRNYNNSNSNSNTPPPIWTLSEYQHSLNTNFNNSPLTARQLASNLWHFNSVFKMSKHFNNINNKNAHFSNHLNLGLELNDDVTSDEQPVSTGSFHRQIAASVIRHHKTVDRNGRALQPVSPASYCSSMEMTPYNHAASPSSSLEYKGRMVDPSHNLKTSTELLKVLNRIWCLEEQHASNISVTKALRTDLDNARARIKDLLREKQMDRQVIDGLMKQKSEQKLVRKNMEQDRLQSALQSVRQELEDERKLRKRSESLHRKMAREISEMKSSFSKGLNELEREQHARILLEDLCDEFAIGIRDYEQELRSLNYKNDKEQVRKEHVDNLILHISEAWLDERVQMKLAEKIRSGAGELSTVVDKLRPEIETFLKARQQTVDSRENFEDPSKFIKRGGLRRRSLESYPLNEATSAPKHEDDDDESIDSESNCFELNKNLGADYSEERAVEEPNEVNNGLSVTGLQARFEKHMTRMMLHNGNTQKDASCESTNQDGLAVEGLLERSSRRFVNRGKSNHLLENLLRNNSSSIEGERIHPVSDLPDDSHENFLLAGPASPVKKWEPKFLSEDPDIRESSTRWSNGPRENTLKARLLEARLEGRHLLSKGSKGSA